MCVPTVNTILESVTSFSIVHAKTVTWRVASELITFQRQNIDYYLNHKTMIQISWEITELVKDCLNKRKCYSKD